MTDQEMIKVYCELDDEYGNIHDQIDNLEEDKDALCDEMDGVKYEWLKTHKCSCDLIGQRCRCSHKDVK